MTTNKRLPSGDHKVTIGGRTYGLAEVQPGVWEVVDHDEVPLGEIYTIYDIADAPAEYGARPRGWETRADAYEVMDESPTHARWQDAVEDLARSGGGIAP